MIPLEKKEQSCGVVGEYQIKKEDHSAQVAAVNRTPEFYLQGCCTWVCIHKAIYAKFSNPKLKQNHHVSVDHEMREDCKVWLKFLNSYQAMCRPFIDFN